MLDDIQPVDGLAADFKPYLGFNERPNNCPEIALLSAMRTRFGAMSDRRGSESTISTGSCLPSSIQNNTAKGVEAQQRQNHAWPLECLTVATFIVGISVAVIIGAAGAFAYVVLADGKRQTGP